MMQLVWGEGGEMRERDGMGWDGMLYMLCVERGNAFKFVDKTVCLPLAGWDTKM